MEEDSDGDDHGAPGALVQSIQDGAQESEEVNVLQTSPPGMEVATEEHLQDVSYANMNGADNPAVSAVVVVETSNESLRPPVDESFANLDVEPAHLSDTVLPFDVNAASGPTAPGTIPFAGAVEEDMSAAFAPLPNGLPAQSVTSPMNHTFIEPQLPFGGAPEQVESSAVGMLDIFPAAPALSGLSGPNSASELMYAQPASSLPEWELAPLPEIRAFAKLQFDDGAFYMNTYSVEIGRDIRAAKRAFFQDLEVTELVGRKGTKSSSAVDVPQTPIQLHRDGSRMCRSLVSNSGGIVGEDYEMHATRRRKSKKSKSKSSSSRHPSRNNSMVLPNGDRDYQSLAMRSLRDANDVAHLDVSALRPSPHECPLIPIHPPTMPAGFGSKHNSISRKHIRIAYNFDRNNFEMIVIGRNGAFHDGSHHPKGQVIPLHNGSEIQIGGVFIRFLLPDAHVAEVDGESQSKMSFDFENGRGESITMADSSGEEEGDEVDAESSDEGQEKEQAQSSFRGHVLHAGVEDERVEDVADEDEEEQEVEGDEEEEGEEEEDEEEEEIVRPPARSKIRKKGYTSQQRKPKSRSAKRNGQKAAAKKAVKPKAVPQKEIKSEFKAEDDTAKSGKLKGDRRTNAKISEEEIQETTEKEGITIKLEDVPPGIVIPPRRKGPGRPPKNGLMSKREQNLVNKHQKEIEKRLALGLSPPPELDLNQGKVTRPRKGSKDNAGEEENSARPRNSDKRESLKQASVDSKDAQNQSPPSVDKGEKAPKPARSPSPPMIESDYTEEQMQRPSQNYVQLIYEAISNSKTGSMSLPQIYSAIEHAHPWYRFRVGTQGWQSSVRHNLSQNTAFEKVSKEGKGYAWGIVPGAVIEKEKRKRVSPPPQPPGYYPPVPHQSLYPYGVSALQSYPNPGYTGPYAPQSMIRPFGSPHGGLPAQQSAGKPASTYASPYAPKASQDPPSLPPQSRPPRHVPNAVNGYQAQHPELSSAHPQNAAGRAQASPAGQGPSPSPAATQVTSEYPTPAKTMLTSAAVVEHIARFKQAFIENATGTSKSNVTWITRTFDSALLRVSHPEKFSKPPDAAERAIMKALEDQLARLQRQQSEAGPGAVSKPEKELVPGASNGVPQQGPHQVEQDVSEGTPNKVPTVGQQPGLVSPSKSTPLGTINGTPTVEQGHVRQTSSPRPKDTTDSSAAPADAEKRSSQPLSANPQLDDQASVEAPSVHQEHHPASKDTNQPQNLIQSATSPNPDAGPARSEATSGIPSPVRPSCEPLTPPPARTSPKANGHKRLASAKRKRAGDGDVEAGGRETKRRAGEEQQQQQQQQQQQEKL